tara:strand:+ start:43 stop:399 length:357 start_codon:yes stop_codon:yes gene_type:complete
MKERILRSFQLNGKGMFLMLASALCTSLGQLFWKISSFSTLGVQFLGLGFIMYSLGAGVMIIAFRFGRFSVLHPMMCLSYVFALFFGVIFLNEVISVQKIFGVVSIMVGVALLGGGDY